jgi:hypothetical protein
MNFVPSTNTDVWVLQRPVKCEQIWYDVLGWEWETERVWYCVCSFCFILCDLIKLSGVFGEMNLILSKSNSRYDYSTILEIFGSLFSILYIFQLLKFWVIFSYFLLCVDFSRLSID